MACGRIIAVFLTVLSLAVGNPRPHAVLGRREGEQLLQRARLQTGSAAPGGAPGAAPGAAPAGPTDKWGADTHAEEFGGEYAHHEHKTVKEPHVGDAAWQSEMHANPGDFDPHGQDFLTDSRSPVQRGTAAPVALGLATALAAAVTIL